MNLKKKSMNALWNIVNEATDYAETAPYADPEDALKHVYAEKTGGTNNGGHVLY